MQNDDLSHGSIWSNSFSQEGRFQDYEYPKVSIIIPTLNCAPLLGITLDSVLSQIYPNYEVIIIDGGSQDHTLDTIKEYRDDRIRLYPLSSYHRYEMLNKGIAQAEGSYLNFLSPGDYYLYQSTLRELMNLALESNRPDLLFCGTLKHFIGAEEKILHTLSSSLLEQGIQPTALSSCWFRRDLFSKIGKFNVRYFFKGEFDLFCRFCLHIELQTISLHRFLVDYDLKVTSFKDFRRCFFELGELIYRYYGVKALLRWIFSKNGLVRFLKTAWSFWFK